MKMKKLLCIAIAAIMVLALAACGSNNQSGDPSSAPSDAASPSAENTAPAEAQYVVGIAQQMTHDALDAGHPGLQGRAE